MTNLSSDDPKKEKFNDIQTCYLIFSSTFHFFLQNGCQFEPVSLCEYLRGKNKESKHLSEAEGRRWWIRIANTSHKQLQVSGSAGRDGVAAREAGRGAL